MMTRNRWFALGTGAATAALALGVAAAIVISARGGQLIHEQDGQGVLASAGGPGVWNGFAFREDDPGPWTMGYKLCVMEPGKSAVLESVYPAHAVGSGLQLLGARVREFQYPWGGSGIISQEGYPPDLPGPSHPLRGYVVQSPCGDSAPGAEYTELDVGVGKPAGSTGGGWNGIDVAYRVGSQRYVVTFDDFVDSCGPEAPAYAGCSGPPGSPSADGANWSMATLNPAGAANLTFGTTLPLSTGSHHVQSLLPGGESGLQAWRERQ